MAREMANRTRISSSNRWYNGCSCFAGKIIAIDQKAASAQSRRSYVADTPPRPDAGNVTQIFGLAAETFQFLDDVCIHHCTINQTSGDAYESRIPSPVPYFTWRGSPQLTESVCPSFPSSTAITASTTI